MGWLRVKRLGQATVAMAGPEYGKARGSPVGMIARAPSGGQNLNPAACQFWMMEKSPAAQNAAMTRVTRMRGALSSMACFMAVVLSGYWLSRMILRWSEMSRAIASAW